MAGFEVASCGAAETQFNVTARPDQLVVALVTSVEASVPWTGDTQPHEFHLPSSAETAA